MQRSVAERAFKIAHYVVLALMAISILYAGYISVIHWAGIGV